MTAQLAEARAALRPWYVVGLALVAATLVGGAVTSLAFTAFVLATDSVGMTMGYRAYLVLGIAFALATPLCLVGLLAVGAPVWWLLRLKKQDDMRTCVAAGAVSSAIFGLAYLVVNNDVPVSDIGWTGLLFLPVFLLPGAACGGIMRWLAYRPSPIPRAGRAPPQTPA